MIWSKFQSNTARFLSTVQKTHEFSDVTLVCDNAELVPAHRVIISAGSSFFETILRKTGFHPQPLVYLKGVSQEDLVDILTFLYTGETRVHKQGLDTFLALARSLGVRGFGDKEEGVEITQKGEEEALEEKQKQIPQDNEKEVGPDDPLAYVNMKADLLVGAEAFSFVDCFVEEISESKTERKNKTKKGDDILPNEPINMKVDTMGTVAKVMKRPVKEKKTKVSNVWKFAQKLPGQNGKCNFCGKIIKYLSNLRQHLQNKHSEEQNVLYYLGESFLPESEQIKEKYLNKAATNAAIIESEVYRDEFKQFPVWKFSQQLDGMRCICNICQKIAETTNGSTQEIRQHVMKDHHDQQDVLKLITRQVEEIKNINDEQKIENIEVKTTVKRKVSAVWKYFEKTLDNKSKCTLCPFVCLNRGSTAMLWTHLRQNHFDNPNVVSDSKTTWRSYLNEPSELIAHNDDEYLCQLCHKKFTHKAIPLDRHMAIEHQGQQAGNGLNGLKPLGNMVETKNPVNEWDYFDKDQHNRYAKCQLCLYKIFKVHEGILTDLRDHLIELHQSVLM